MKVRYKGRTPHLVVFPDEDGNVRSVQIAPGDLLDMGVPEPPPGFEAVKQTKKDGDD